MNEIPVLVTRVAATLSGALLLIVPPAASAGPRSPQAGSTPAVLKLATTTSTVDTGLFKAILPAFEAQCGCRVDVVAVGTGQALELGRRGDAGVLLVHAPEQEAAFMTEGHAVRRDDVMYNDFVIVGPAADPAGVAKAMFAKDALRAIRAAAAPFASRGDKSGTHTKELALWKAAGTAPGPGAAWYLSVGQGMGETLTFANERRAYALTDRATWTSMRAKLPNLRQLFGGASAEANSDRDLRNQYGVIVIDQARHAGVKTALGLTFADWLLSEPTQKRIGAFGRDAAGHSLFYPDSDEFKATDQLRVVVGAKARTFTLNDLRKATTMIRNGTGQHEGISAYTAARLSDAELAAILGWLAKPGGAASADPFVVPEARRSAVLAYERDGKPMTGRQGLIQLVVGWDEFASRYSHWVSEVRVRQLGWEKWGSGLTSSVLEMGVGSDFVGNEIRPDPYYEVRYR